MKREDTIEDLVGGLLEALLLELSPGEKLPDTTEDILRGGVTHAFDKGVLSAHDRKTLAPPGINDRVTQLPSGDVFAYLTDSEIDALVGNLEEATSEPLFPEE